MKKVPTIFTLTIMAFSTFCALGQDSVKTEKIKEFYFSFANISNLSFSIKYKQQLINNIFFKTGAVNISADGKNNLINNGSNYTYAIYFLSAGLECGIEFHKTIKEKFTFFHGPNISFTYYLSISEYDYPPQPYYVSRKSITQIYYGGIPYTLGFLFQINNHFLLSTEINPGLFFAYSIYAQNPFPQYNYKDISANFRFANSNGLLSIVYRL